MRIDKFLSVVNIVKRRSIAEDMCKSGVVSINDIVVKPSKELKIGDVITLSLSTKTQKYEVLSLPNINLKSTPKAQQSEFVKIL